MSYESNAIREAARGNWAGILSGLGARADLLTNNHSPCPGCGGKDRFRFDDKEGNGTFLCSQGGGGVLAGDGLAAVMHFRGIEFPAACQLLGDYLQLEQAPDERREWARRSAPGVAPEPVVDPDSLKAQIYDEAALSKYHRPEMGIDEAWFAERSRVPLTSIKTPGDFLDRVFRPAEKILCFTSYRSQGQFMQWAGKGTFRLGDRPGVKAAPSAFPTQSTDGAWFLSQPVDGKWRAMMAGKNPKMSRRFWECVSRWPFMVLESDEAPPHLWLSFLAQLPLPISAIYTSGGRSIHALIDLNAASKSAWDELRAICLPILSKVGADPGAITAVRLTRLPGVKRRLLRCRKCKAWKGFQPKGRKCGCGEFINPDWAEWCEQKLLYLNPNPDPGLSIREI